MKAKKFDSFEKFDMEPGSYCIEDGKHLVITLPCGHNFIPDGKWQEQDRDDETKITLTPSIFCTPRKPCWHGYLTKGEFITA